MARCRRTWRTNRAAQRRADGPHHRSVRELLARRLEERARGRDQNLEALTAEMRTRNEARQRRVDGEIAISDRAAPSNGADSDAILRDVLGCDESRIAALRASGAIGEPQ